MIKTEGLSKDYGGGRGILGLDLEVPAGTIFGFIGPNGSGKTTTIKILCGLIRPDAGHAWIDGLAVEPRHHVRIKSIIGFLPDEFGVYEQMSVWEYLDFFGATYRLPPKQRRQRIDEVLAITDAAHMIDYQVASLSRGMHQKIGIAKTMLHDPKLLILDEPANGLDPYARIEMRETILRLKDMGKTIMLSSHILPELGTICDLVGIIEKGKLLTQGTVRDITHSLQQNIVLEVQVLGDAATAAAVLQALPAVKAVAHSGQELRVDFVGKRQEIADLNEHLVHQGVRVVSLKEAEVDLENVFLAVTGRKEGKVPGLGHAAGHAPAPAPGAAAAAPAATGPLTADAATNAAILQARATVADFVQALDRPDADQEGFAVKKLFQEGDQEELLWLVDLSFDGTLFHGRVRNAPRQLTTVAQDDAATVSFEDLADWMYIADGLLVGGYTIRLKYERLSAEERLEFLADKPYRIRG